MSDDLQYSSRADNKRKFDDPVAPPSSAPPPRRSTGFSAPLTSPPSDSQTQPSYNSVPPPADEIQLAKQRAQEIAARLFNNAEAKRPRIENGGDDSGAGGEILGFQWNFVRLWGENFSLILGDYSSGSLLSWLQYFGTLQLILRFCCRCW